MPVWQVTERGCQQVPRDRWLPEDRSCSPVYRSFPWTDRAGHDSKRGMGKPCTGRLERSYYP